MRETRARMSIGKQCASENSGSSRTLMADTPKVYTEPITPTWLLYVPSPGDSKRSTARNTGGRKRLSI